MDMWNDFDNQNNQGSNTPKQTPNLENPIQGGPTDMDDFFGGSGIQAPAQPVNEQVNPFPNQNFQSQSSPGQGNLDYFDQENDKDGEFAPGQAMNNPLLVSHLRRIEEDRMKVMYQREQAERAEKIKRIEKAKSELNQWKAERIKNVEQRKKINRENQELLARNKGENEYKNPWEKIVNNVAIKESDYPGNKDVSAMRTAILNKKGDMASK